MKGTSTAFLLLLSLIAVAQRHRAAAEPEGSTMTPNEEVSNEKRQDA
jgi:hypothetical protein